MAIVLPTGTTININSPSTAALEDKVKQLTEKVEGIQFNSSALATIGKEVFDNVVKPKLLSPRQIAKKMLIAQGQASPIPIEEEDAQLIVYGKVYYKNGKLYDNDLEDPSCLSQPSDEDYQPPLDENHPLWQKVTGMIDELKKSIQQLGVKIGEFISAITAAFSTIIVSLTALVASVTILPFGSGIPAAITAVQTMIATIKELQAKVGEILPFLGIFASLALLLPASASGVVAIISGVIQALMAITTPIIALGEPIQAVTSKLGSATKKMNNNKLKIELKAEPETIPPYSQEGSKLSANANGGDYQFTYEWTIDDTEIQVPKDPTMEEDDGTRIVKPLGNTVYRCRVRDGKGTLKEGTVTVKVV